MNNEIENKKRLEELQEVMRKAEKLAYEHFQNCELGNEREASYERYENIRNAMRVY